MSFGDPEIGEVKVNNSIEERLENIDRELRKLREELRVELLPKKLSEEQVKRVLKAFVGNEERGDETTYL